MNDLFKSDADTDSVEKRGGFSHDKTVGKEEWLTPKHVLDALGEFDTDPCAAQVRPWSIGTKYNFTIFENGLIRPWFGRVWLNPPYGSQLPRWLSRMAKHDGGGIALVFARTETSSFFPWVWDHAHGFLFLRGRLTFCDNTGKLGKMSAGAPSMLISYSPHDSEVLKHAASASLPGKFLRNG